MTAYASAADIVGLREVKVQSVKLRAGWYQRDFTRPA